MSTTVTGGAPVAPLSMLQKLEAEGRAVWTGAEHAASILVGAVAEADVSLSSLVANSPLFMEAWDMGVAAADAYGLGPGITAAEDVFASVMSLAHTLASGLAKPLVVVTPAVVTALAQPVTISGAAAGPVEHV